MVGVVLVSHSRILADGLLDLVQSMGVEANIAVAGGQLDGNFGTSYQRIMCAINKVYTKEGAVVLADFGSTATIVREVLKDFGANQVVLVDAPLVEGGVEAVLAACEGKNLFQVVEAVQKVGQKKKW